VTMGPKRIVSLDFSAVSKEGKRKSTGFRRWTKRFFYGTEAGRGEKEMGGTGKSDQCRRRKKYKKK